MTRPRTLIAYDHGLFLDALALLLRHDFDIVFATTDFAAVLDAVGQHRPALVVQGLPNPVGVGLGLISEIRDLDPNIAVAVISRSDDSQLASEAFRRGADAYMLTDSSPAELLEGVRAAITHRELMSSDVIDD